MCIYISKSICFVPLNYKILAYQALLLLSSLQVSNKTCFCASVEQKQWCLFILRYKITKHKRIVYNKNETKKLTKHLEIPLSVGIYPNNLEIFAFCRRQITVAKKQLKNRHKDTGPSTYTYFRK